MSHKAGNRSGSTRNLYAFLLVLTCVVFLWVYFSVAKEHALNGDEGLYATGALRFADGDLLLKRVDTDKPPLVYQLQGLAVLIFGRSDMSVKIPNALFIIALFVITFFFGKKLFNGFTAIVAVLILATSPYLGKVSIGAMTDPPAILFLTISLLCNFNKRTALSGFFFGMALLTRQMALIYFPIILFASAIHWWVDVKKWKRFKTEAKEFIKGVAPPAAWLIIWSAFFEREPFQWLFQELLSGKVVLGAKRAGIIERISFWFNEMSTFLFTKFGYAVLALIVAIIVYQYSKHGKGNENRVIKKDKFVLMVLAFSVLYYPVIHTIMGAPLYRRMMFPALPLASLAAAYIFYRGVIVIHKSEKRWIKIIGTGVYITLLIFAGFTNLRALSIVHSRDDNPELASYINEISDKPSVIFSPGMNRELMFYLHKNRISRKQFKTDPGKMAGLVEKYPGRLMLLALKESKMPMLLPIRKALNPKYELTRIYKTRRKLASLFEIKAKAKVIADDHNPQISFYKDDDNILMDINRETIENEIIRYVKNTLRCKGDPDVRVDVPDNAALAKGRLKALEIVAFGITIDGIEVEKAKIKYTDIKIDLAQLFGANQLVLLEKKSSSGKITVSEKGIGLFVASKNKNIKDLLFKVNDSQVSIGGTLSALGLKMDFIIGGALTLNEKGAVYIRTGRGSLEKWKLPWFILNIIEKNVNPTFTAEIESLGLVAKEVNMEAGKLVFTME